MKREFIQKGTCRKLCDSVKKKNHLLQLFTPHMAKMQNSKWVHWDLLSPLICSALIESIMKIYMHEV